MFEKKNTKKMQGILLYICEVIRVKSVRELRYLLTVCLHTRVMLNLQLYCSYIMRGPRILESYLLKCVAGDCYNDRND